MITVLPIVSVFFVVSGILCLILILLHILPHHRQPMKIMETVWPLTGLWANWPGLLLYWKIGRVKKERPMMDMQMPMHRMSSSLKWQSTVLSTLHCGAGCTLADLIGETFTGFVPLSIGGSFIAGQWTLDYILALIIGIYFQYAAIHAMEKLPRTVIIKKAFKADFFSLTAWQVGMYGWMAIVMFLLFPETPLSHRSAEFWFMMQIAMFFGFLTSYPVNGILIKKGIKKGM